MSRFEPFRGVRYDTVNRAIDDVTAPPYDVIDARDRSALVQRSEHNIVRIDLPDEDDGPGRYDLAADRFSAWLDEGVLVQDTEPSFYIYRMDYQDDQGNAAHTVGVLGALELSRPGEGAILPHEHTTPKAKSDRLDLLRATRVNLSAIWGLSLSHGLTACLAVTTEPDESWDDEDGVTHSLWRVSDPDQVAAISASVAETPVVIADGHHRFETSVAYRDERREVDGTGGPADLAMIYIVELVEDELTVRPIHRLLTGITSDTALVTALEACFEISNAGTAHDDITEQMRATGSLALVAPDGSARLLKPRADMFEGVDDLDSSRLSKALEPLDGVEVRYQHGVDRILRALSNGEANYGVLLRPATVAQIEKNAHDGRRMPPKTTFFHPKPRTGMVMRRTDR